MAIGTINIEQWERLRSEFVTLQNKHKEVVAQRDAFLPIVQAAANEPCECRYVGGALTGCTSCDAKAAIAKMWGE